MYLGGKRSLTGWIGNVLAKACPSSDWSKMTFTDLFMGGSAMSYWAKAQGFKHVFANDIAFRSEVTAKALLTNQQTIISREESLYLTQALPEEPGFIETNFSPDVFATIHAKSLDRGFHAARQHPSSVTSALLLLTMWHLTNDFVAFPTSLGTSNRPIAKAIDGLHDWDEISPKRFNDGSLKRVCTPVFSRLEPKRQLVNRGVMGGSPVTFTRQDAIERLATVQSDILYLDPPYAGTISYERANEVLDSLLTGELPEKRPAASAFSKGVDVLETLLSGADHIPVWLLSYGNKEISLPELEDLVRSHANGRKVEGFSRHYRHLAHVSKNDNNQELLILAYPKKGF